MASITPSAKKSGKGAAQRVSPIRFLMYFVLIAYAVLSALPLFVMISGSLMNLGEVNAGRLVPNDLDGKFSDCILFANDTFRNDDGEEVTRHRFSVNITAEAAEAAGQGIDATRDASLINRDEVFRIPFVTNYCVAWKDANLGEYIVNTVIIVAITIGGLLIFTPLAAYTFARMEFPGKNVLFGIMLATLMVPEMVINLPNFLIVTRIGDALGSGGAALCGDLRNCWINNWPALTIPFMVSPFTIFLMRQQFATIPMELWDAARMDGAGHLRFLAQIVIPLSRPVLLVVVLFSFIGGWNALAWPILVTSGDEWRPISYGLQSFLQEEGNFAHLRLAGSMITALPVLILYAFTQRYFVEGLSTSGLKG
jgi:ABC-type glycerol-3-phosphate transport system permease component